MSAVPARAVAPVRKDERPGESRLSTYSTDGPECHIGAGGEAHLHVEIRTEGSLVVFVRREVACPARQWDVGQCKCLPGQCDGAGHHRVRPPSGAQRESVLHVDGVVRPLQHARQVPQGTQPGPVVADRGVVAGVQEALVGVEGLEGAPGHGEAVGRAPQVVEVERQPERAHDEGPMKVQFAAPRPPEAGTLAEAVVEAGSHLGELSLEPGAGQGVDGRVEVLRANKQVDVGEGAQRRIGIVEVGERRPLEHAVVHAPPVEEVRNVEEIGLELEAELHGRGMGGEHVLVLFRRDGQVPVVDDGGEESGQAVKLHPLDQLRPFPCLQRLLGEFQGRSSQALGGHGPDTASRHEHSGLLHGADHTTDFMARLTGSRPSASYTPMGARRPPLMKSPETLRVLRRWRWLIVAGVLIGAVVGWVSAPGSGARAPLFEATHTLIAESGAEGRQIYRAALLATQGAVPDRVAGRLGLDQRTVRSMIAVETPGNSGILLISGRSPQKAQAEALADVTAEELIVELGGPGSPLRTVEPAEAEPVEDSEIVAPRSRPGRALLLGAFGLFLGVAGALGVERLDDRVRSKLAAEEALGAPVLAEVPLIARPKRGRLLDPAEDPHVVEQYRRLRTGLDRWAASRAERGGSPVVVVTSPRGAEGATSTVAHLATTVGEVGRSVVAISADLRRPRLHHYFDRNLGPGLSDVLRGAPDVRRLADLNIATTIRGVRLIPSGQPVPNPTLLLQRIGDFLDEARALGDLVLVDAPPLLTTSDGADLALQSDGVLLVVRVAHTSRAAAVRSAELLGRLNVPVIGVVLIGADGYSGRA